MSGLFTVVVVMCASALICSLVQTFVTDGSTLLLSVVWLFP